MRGHRMGHYVAWMILTFISLASWAQPREGYVIKASSLPLQGLPLQQLGEQVGLKGEEPLTATLEAMVPAGNGRFSIALHCQSSPAGASHYQLKVGGRLVGRYDLPASQSTRSQVKTWQLVEVNEGEKFQLTLSNSSDDGRSYSQALWSKLQFLPLDFDPGKVAANLQQQRTQVQIEAGPKLAGPRQVNGDGSVVISGERKTWHPLTLTLNGPFANEQDLSPNPFLDYRMSVTFAHESGVPTYTVPGYFAADGDAAESSAVQGTQWRAHLSADKAGKWSYRISFVEGKQSAVNPATGHYLAPYHDQYGTFEVLPSDKSGRDFRAKGRLQYVGGHMLRYAETGDYFLKAGTDAPETFLAYADFDNTIALKPSVPLKTWSPHRQDFKPGDPSWQGGKGKNIIGALNYLAQKHLNAFSFLTYNAGGDGDNIWPYVERNGKLHFDCSKLDQWNIVFTHAQTIGLYLHFKLQENELDDNRLNGKTEPVLESLDGGRLGVERKLYLRELIARYAHHLALNWNLGEENTQSYPEQRDMAAYIHNLDAYDHHLIIHSFPNQQERVYRSLLGSQSVLTGASLQNGWWAAHQKTLEWVRASRAAGKPWVVANDEQNPAGLGVPPDPGYQGFDGWAQMKNRRYNLHDIRKYTLWGNIMAGGAGVEYYFGYRLKENDLTAEDLRSRDRSWRYAGIAVDFFAQQHIPIQRMRNMNRLVGNVKDDNSKYCLANEGEIYLVYLPNGGESSLDLSQQSGQFQVRWFNPREGGRCK